MTRNWIAAAAVCLCAAPLAAGPDDAHIRFEQYLGFTVVVDVKHSDGSPDRSKTIETGSADRFHFGCGHHQRQFEVYAATDTAKETLLASGTFELRKYTDVDTIGYPCGEEPLDESVSDYISYNGSENVRVTYAVTARHRAKFMLTKKKVELPVDPL